MAHPVHGEHRRHLRGRTRFSPVYVAMLLLSLHWSVVTYINSTFLEQFISTQAIGMFYIIGSALTILTFLMISKVLDELGNYQLTIGLAIAEVGVLLGMTLSHDLRLVVPLFIAHHAIVPLLLFNLDVFMEGIIGHEESHTGGKRGLLLTVMSIAGAVAPLVAGLLIGDGEPRFLGNGLERRPVFCVGQGGSLGHCRTSTGCCVRLTIWSPDPNRICALRHAMLQRFCQKRAAAERAEKGFLP
jgi:MFS family permease